MNSDTQASARGSEPDPARGTRNLLLRILSALVLVPVVLVCVWLGTPWFAAMLAVVALAAGAERAAGREVQQRRRHARDLR